MKHLKLFFALFAMLALGITNAWADVTCDFTTQSATHSAYNDSWMYGDFTVYGGANNNGGWKYVKMGGKETTLSTYNPVYISSPKMTSSISKVQVSIAAGSLAKTGMSVNDWGVYVYSDANMTIQVDHVAGGEITKDAKVFDFVPTIRTDWSANYYYKVSFNLANTTTTNGIIWVDKVTFVASSSDQGSEETVVSPILTEAAEFETSQEVTMTAPEGAAIFYTTDGSEPTTSSTKYTAPLQIFTTTTVKAIAVKDEETSAVVEKTYTQLIAKTCEEAVGQCATAGTEKYVVTGYVTEIVTEYNSSFKNISFWMADAMGCGTQKLQAYRVSPTNTGEENVKVGDKVKVIGALKLYDSTPEFNTGTYTIVTPATEYTITNNNDATKGEVTVAATATQCQTVTLSVTPKSGWLFNAWEVKTAAGEAVEVTDNAFIMPGANVTVTALYTANAKPDATLTLSKNGVEETTTYKQDDVIILPDFESDCSKAFVGWSANANCTTAPEYKAGDEFTLTNIENKLFAVYADVAEGDEVTIKHTSKETTKLNKENAANTYFDLDENKWTIIGAQGKANNNVGLNKDGSVRLYYHSEGSNTLTITAPEKVETIKFTFTGKDYSNASVMVDGVAVSADEDTVYTINANTFVIGNANESNVQVRIKQIDVTFAGEQSNYSTTCAAALENPTFSLTEGKYTTAQSVTITATAGNVCYTLDGSEPTEASAQYTAAITLDECGEHTIKAIAISGESKSDVVEATYTIKIENFTKGTKEAPITPAEAIAIWDGGCYDNQTVYVKGTVLSASYNSQYKNYSVTLQENNFQFYRMVDSNSLVTVPEDGTCPIGQGDVVIVSGTLDNYKGTYQLAANCVLESYEKSTTTLTDISNTQETAYTVAKAHELLADTKNDFSKLVYVKGYVAVAPTSLTNDKYLTYSISDDGASTSALLKIYRGLDIEGANFTAASDIKVGDYVVVAGNLLNYNGTYELNEGNYLVEHKPVAAITIDAVTMEIGSTHTISATTIPTEAASAITYTIKENAANAISLAGNVITANAVGTATITASVVDADTYFANSIDFTVTVTEKAVTETVVILAQCQGQWYAMKGSYFSSKTNVLDAIPVEYINGTLYNVAETDKASIEWQRSMTGNKATFKNGDNYLTGGTKTDLKLDTTAFEWDYNGVNYLSGNATTKRTFLYCANTSSSIYGFKNYAISNMGKVETNGTVCYSLAPEVVAPVYATAEIYTRDVTADNYGTICLPNASSNYSGAEFYEVAYLKVDQGLWLDQLPANATLEAGKPYIFKATAAKIAVAYEGTAVASPIAGVGGLTGTFTDIAANADLVNNYIIAENKVWVAGTGATLPANRAYINATSVPNKVQPEIPGRRRVCMNENAATGLDQIVVPEGQAFKVIENGQLIIIRDGIKYNVQGQVIK